jgi:uncharacterized protein YjbJ (UPF0337 family)
LREGLGFTKQSRTVLGPMLMTVLILFVWASYSGYFPSRRMRRLQQEQSNMNKDQVKGAAKDVVGKVQEEAGKLVGSKEQQIKGLSKQISGKAQKGLGDVKQAVEDLGKS